MSPVGTHEANASRSPAGQGTLWPSPARDVNTPECVHGVTGYGLPKRPRLLSASKRTDIPAFYLEWLIRAVDRGWVDVPNPMLSGKFRKLAAAVAGDGRALPEPTPAGRIALDDLIASPGALSDGEVAAGLARTLTHVSLAPEQVVGIVWWSKNYGPYLRRADKFAHYRRQFFQFTINPRSPDLAWLEPDVPPEGEALEQSAALAKRFGGEWVAWRYDPLVFWFEDGEPRSSWDEEFFVRVCREISAAGIRTCITSKVDRYRKFERRMRLHYPGRALRDPHPDEFAGILRRMADIGAEFKVRVETCSEAGVPAACGVSSASCIDARRFQARTAPATDRSLGRDACECHAHIDIGDYETQECGYACIYCYANPNHRLLAGSGR